MVLKRSRCMPDTVIKQVLGNGEKTSTWLVFEFLTTRAVEMTWT